MRIGPFSSFHIQEIVKYLKEQNVEHELIQDPLAIEKMRAVDKSKEPASARTRGFSSNGDFLFLELKPEDAERVFPALEKYGFVPPASEEVAELLERAEYHCPQCNYTSDHIGTCPTHQVELLEYSDWLVATDNANQAAGKIKFAIFLIAVGATAVFLYMR